MSVSPQLVAIMALALTNLFWAGNAIVARFAVDDIPPLTLMFGRWVLAFIILLPFAYPHLKKSWPIIRARWFLLFVLGNFAIATYNTVLYIAAHSTTAINITLVSTSLPLVALLMSWLLLATRPTNWQCLGIAISITGVFIVVTRGSPEHLLQLSFNRGDILMFGLVLLWATYSVLIRKYPFDLKPLVLITVLIAFGLPTIILLFVAEWFILPEISLSATSIPIFLYVGIFPSILSYVFWIYGVKTVGPNIAALSTYLMPLFAAILAIPLLGEGLYYYHFVGGLLIIIGFYFGSFFKRNKNEA